MNNSLRAMKGLTGYLDMKNAASYLGVTVGTLYQWVSHGKVQTYKVGKYNVFRPQDLDAARAPRLRIVSKDRRKK